MTRRLALLFVLLAVLIMLYAVMLRLTPSPRLKRPAGMSARSYSEDMPFRPGAYATVYDEVTVTINIPPLSQFPPGWAQVDGCPHMRISRMLGVAMGASSGCPIFRVDSGGPASEAGIQPGDRLGEPTDCARSLYRSLAPREEPRTIEWTVRRPEAAEQASPVADPPHAAGKQQGTTG